MNTYYAFWRTTLVFSLVLLIPCGVFGATPPAPNPKTMLPVDELGPKSDPVDTNLYHRVVYVSPTSDYTSPEAALNGITNNKTTRRYVVLVAAGYYKTVNLQMKENIDLFGGFDPEDWSRDIFANPTILDAQNEGSVLLGASFSRVDGFFITGGFNQRDADISPAGLSSEDPSPSVYLGPFQGHGGGVSCLNASPTIANNIFHDNKTLMPTNFNHSVIHQIGSQGAAIALLRYSSGKVHNNIFYNNTTGVGDGAGIMVREYS